MDASTPNAGDLLDLDITTVAHGGVFVGRHGGTSADGRGGRVVFVPDAIPGERVRVRLTDVGKKSFWRGEVLEVLDASSERRPHIWRQADVENAPERRPGGADFGHIRLDHQRELKRQVLAEALTRFGGVDLPVEISAAGEAESADGTGWRTRVGLHVDAGGRVGPFAARSHTVIEVQEHPLSTAEIERAALQSAAAGGAAPGRIDLVQSADGRVRRLDRSDAARTAPREAREVIVERVGSREFRVDAGGFWQVHRLAAVALDGAVRRAIGDLAGSGIALDPEAWHLDLYGGVGLFASAIADLGGSRVTSVEADARATEHAGENLADWVGARAETSRVDRYLTRLAADASARERERLAHGLVVLDPPRAGAGADVVRSIAGLGPTAVVYVACDPVALARDVATFRDDGYDVVGVRALDLFPNSHHVEAVATLVRRADAASPTGRAR